MKSTINQEAKREEDYIKGVEMELGEEFKVHLFNLAIIIASILILVLIMFMPPAETGYYCASRITNDVGQIQAKVIMDSARYPIM